MPRHFNTCGRFSHAASSPPHQNPSDLSPSLSARGVHLQIMDNESFLSGHTDTGFIERTMLAK